MQEAAQKHVSIERAGSAKERSSRDKILDAALSVFARKGFEGASTQEISEYAGVNKRLIFYYFESKEELYLASLEEFFQGVDRLLQNFCVSPADMEDKWLALLKFSDNFIDFVAGHQEPVRILVREIMSEGRFMDVLVSRFIRPTFKAGEQYLSGLLYPGESDQKAIKHLLLSFGGANIFYFLLSPLLERVWDMETASKEQLDERKKEMRRFILRTL